MRAKNLSHIMAIATEMISSNLSASLMSAVRPIEISSTTVIICVNELVFKQ